MKRMKVLFWLIVLMSLSSSSAQNHMDQIMMIEGAEEDDWLGLAVSNAGDLNGDGYDDVAIGVPGYYPKAIPGYVYILFGADSMDNEPDIVFGGENNMDQFGKRVSFAGDVNGDGWSDLIVSANYESLKGKVYLYYGGSELDTIPDLSIVGEGPYDSFNRISNAGDVDGDGFDDIIVGALGYDVNHNYDQIGKVYLFKGGTNMDTVPDWTVDGYQLGVRMLGISVSSADVNGDGFSDLIMGCEDEAFIFFGGAQMDTVADVHLNDGGLNFGLSVSGVGDVNGDGYDDVVVGDYSGWGGSAYLYLGGESMDSIADLVFLGDTIYNRNFGYRVSWAGDLNGDSLSDFLISDPDAYAGAWGMVYVYLGKQNMDNICDLAIPTPSPGVGGEFGHALSCAGDVNGDGYDDIIVGEPYYYNEDRRGRAFVFAGNGDLTRIVEVLTPEYQILDVRLFQNSPNPFHSRTVIEYSSPCPAKVTLSIYDIAGRLVRRLLSGQRVESGEYRVSWDGKDEEGKEVRRGVYFYTLRGELFSQTRKIILLR